MTRSIKELIKQRRSQMLIHSYLYYGLDSPIISDSQWQDWANDLEHLQNEYPNECKIDWYDKIFSDWSGTTGCHLPMEDPWVIRKAKQLLDYETRITTNKSITQ